MTANELYEATLRKLGVLGSGETAEDNDIDLVKEAFYHLCAEYRVSTIVKTGTGIHIAYMLASDLASDFGLPEPTIQRLAVQRQIAEKKFLNIVREDYDTDTVTEATYY